MALGLSSLLIKQLKTSRDQASFEDIFEHLTRCDKCFEPRLSSMVSLMEYADKLQTKARRVEFWYEQRLVGLVALYLNEDSAYISNLSLDPEWRGGQNSRKLLRDSEQLVLEAKLSRVQLEVGMDNRRARRFYQKNGFLEYAPPSPAGMLQLQKKLESEQ